VVINDRKETALHAAQQGHAHIVGYLLHLKVGDKEGEKLKKDALQDAIHEGLALAVQTILHQVSHLQVQGGQYENGLQTASLKGHEQVVKLLLDKGAVVNAQGKFYGNALQAASNQGHEQVVKLLLDKGADEVGEIGLCTSSRCPLETGLWSWPTQRRTRHDTAHALATCTGSFSEVCKTGALATLQRRIFASGQRLGGGRILERIHRPPGGQSTATGRVPL
jgi:hypothetical protein